MGVVRDYMVDKIKGAIDDADRLGIAVLTGSGTQRELDRAKLPVYEQIDTITRYLNQLRSDVEELKMPKIRLG